MFKLLFKMLYYVIYLYVINNFSRSLKRIKFFIVIEGVIPSLCVVTDLLKYKCTTYQIYG